MGSGNFEKFTVYRDRIVGNMQHFVTTRRYGREKCNGSAADPDNVFSRGVIRLGEEICVKAIGVTLLMREGAYSGGWCTPGSSNFDYNDLGMFTASNLFLGLQALEDGEILGSQAFFPQFLQALARKNGHFDDPSSLAEVGEKSQFGCLSLI